MSIPWNLCFSSLDTVRLPKCSDIVSITFFILLNQRVIPCCRQHTTILCIVCIEWCYLLYTCHMGWSGIPVVLGYFNTDRITVVHNPCINIRLSEIVGIVPLLHYPHLHFSFVRGSPRTWYPQIIPQYLIR